MVGQLHKYFYKKSLYCPFCRIKSSIYYWICTCFKSFWYSLNEKIYFVKPKKDTNIIKFTWLAQLGIEVSPFFFSFARNGLLKKLKLLFLIALLPDFIVHSFGPALNLLPAGNFVINNIKEKVGRSGWQDFII